MIGPGHLAMVSQGFSKFPDAEFYFILGMKHVRCELLPFPQSCHGHVNLVAMVVGFEFL